MVFSANQLTQAGSLRKCKAWSGKLIKSNSNSGDWKYSEIGKVLIILAGQLESALMSQPLAETAPSAVSLFSEPVLILKKNIGWVSQETKTTWRERTNFCAI